MYRLIKEKDGRIEVLNASEDKDKMLDALETYVSEHASNGDEYTSCDFEAIREQESENIGSYTISVDSVYLMTDEEIVAAGGGVCAHCHSDETDPSMPEMDEGFITRNINCLICGEDTEEVYSLTGVYNG